MKKTAGFSVLVGAVIGVIALGANVSVANGVWHSVHVGGPDACAGTFGDKPGCDANFSFTALQFEDGRVTGQATDRFAAPNGGVHAQLDCLLVQGNIAHVSGRVTHPKDLEGVVYYSLAADIGRNANDPPDQIGPSYLLSPDFPFSCEEIPFLFPQVFDSLADAPWGQVAVK